MSSGHKLMVQNFRVLDADKNVNNSVARRGEFSRFVGFLAQKGGQIFEDGDLWD